MKYSKAEAVVLTLCAAGIFFFAGWYARGLSGQDSYTIHGEFFHSTPTPAPSATFFRPDPDTIIDLNTATFDDLVALPGLGETKAQAILDDREQNGPFRYVESVTRVSGIGQSTFETLAPYITVSDS